MENNIDARYPTGRFTPKEQYTSEELAVLIDKIAGFPTRLQKAVDGLTPQQMDARYRKGGWTVRQVIHHLADSHMNAYVRLKWTLTEDRPIIKAYDEKAWAETAEITEDPQLSVALLTNLHAKWTKLLKRLSPEDFDRAYLHPENGKTYTLAHQVALYAWHGDHHLGHLQLVKDSST